MMLISLQKVPWYYYGFWTPPSTQKVPWENPWHNNIALAQSTGTMAASKCFFMEGWRDCLQLSHLAITQNLQSNTYTDNHENPISDVPSHDIMQKAPGGSEITGFALA